MIDFNLEAKIVYDVMDRRRSCRKYQEQEITQEELDFIISAGRMAPSGGNSKTAKIVVFRNKTIIKELEQAAQHEFASYELKEGMYRSLYNTIKQAKEGRLHFTYGAPVLIVLMNQKNYGNSMADCVAIVENMLLAATALKLGSCYINQLHWLTDNIGMRSVLAKYGLQENENVYASLVVGYPDQRFSERVDKGNQIIVY